jgi:hypothetical protein
MRTLAHPTPVLADHRVNTPPLDKMAPGASIFSGKGSFVSMMKQHPEVSPQVPSCAC